jgi:hypothetical protein
MQNDRAKFKNVVRGFSLVHDPEGSRYKRKDVSGNATPLCHCEPKAWQSRWGMRLLRRYHSSQ